MGGCIQRDDTSSLLPCMDRDDKNPSSQMHKVKLAETGEEGYDGVTVIAELDPPCNGPEAEKNKEESCVDLTRVAGRHCMVWALQGVLLCTAGILKCLPAPEQPDPEPSVDVEEPVEKDISHTDPQEPPCPEEVECAADGGEPSNGKAKEEDQDLKEEEKAKGDSNEEADDIETTVVYEENKDSKEEAGDTATTVVEAVEENKDSKEEANDMATTKAANEKGSAPIEAENEKSSSPIEAAEEEN